MCYSTTIRKNTHTFIIYFNSQQKGTSFLQLKALKTQASCHTPLSFNQGLHTMMTVCNNWPLTCWIILFWSWRASQLILTNSCVVLHRHTVFTSHNTLGTSSDKNELIWELGCPAALESHRLSLNMMISCKCIEF